MLACQQGGRCTECGGGKGRAPEGDAEQMGITDQTLGQVLDAVERLGLKGSTFVLYTTDHGTPGRNPPLTGGKRAISSPSASRTEGSANS
mgnify:CR=1 FL=1